MADTVVWHKNGVFLEDEAKAHRSAREQEQLVAVEVSGAVDHDLNDDRQVAGDTFDQTPRRGIVVTVEKHPCGDHLEQHQGRHDDHKRAGKKTLWQNAAQDTARRECLANTFVPAGLVSECHSLT